jgi:hypothetical protein
MQFLFIVQMLVIILGPLVKMVLKMIGFGFVSYIGFNLIIGQAQDYLFGLMGDVGPVIQGILGLAKFDVVVNCISPPSRRASCSRGSTRPPTASVLRSGTSRAAPPSKPKEAPSCSLSAPASPAMARP